jgi:glycosyltransferase involved in cell wall biosynthesis
VPVVATAVGGVPEVMVDGETGYLHAVGDVEGMAASAVRILRGGDDDGLGAAARRRAVGHFAEADQVGRYRRIYQRVLAGAAAGEPAAAPV